MSIIFCQCQNAALVPKHVLHLVREGVKSSSQDVVCVDDLCAMAAEHDERFAEWARQDDLVVLACFPRAVKALFAHAKADLPASATLFNLRKQPPEEILAALCLNHHSERTLQTIQASGPDWMPWFPVIDYDRCKNCRQCLNFCLFGVYSMTEAGTVQVSRPHQCKTNCPACARVCPYAAIIFPKYEKSPINGDQVVESDWKKSHAESAASLKDRLSGNIYQLLRSRGSDDPGLPQSVSDLEKLKDQFDIPEDVFKSGS